MPIGRPTEYKPEYVEKAAGMWLAGATDSEVADELDVTVTTLYNWRAKYPDFLAATKYGKEQADERVERSLFQRAVGFEYPAVRIFMPSGAESPVFAEYREYFPPDATAAKHWLNNRKPGEWREKIDHELSGEVAIKRVVADL